MKCCSHDSHPHDCETHAPQQLTRRDTLQRTTSAAMLAALPAAVGASTASAAPADAPSVTVGLTVNGTPHRLAIDPRQSLLDVLRERLDLGGTKKGCNQGACGACTILVDGKRINACLTLAAMHDGARITTVEGLAQDGKLHPLQAAFIEKDGFQCGYCTSGQLLSGVACIAEGHAGTPQEIRAWMSGNICRCGAYAGIVDAIHQTARAIKP